MLVFTGRVPARFSHRICPDGTLVSREVPRFTDIDKAVTLFNVGPGDGSIAHQMFWSVLFNREWASCEVTLGNESIIAWIRTDETLSLVQNRKPQLSPETQERVLSVHWEDDGRFLCFRFHWVRAGFEHCP
eukprot:1566883-Pyramimonas_sp.AAC.1